ncbi:MAG: cell envelope integrity protein CreD [Steroidobacteraceae bacterium]
MAELIDRVTSKMRSSQTLRLVTVGILVLLLQIPIAMIGGQVQEREMRGAEAVEEVSSKWGNQQTLSGPVLVVPYMHRWTEANRDGMPITRTELRHAYFLPENLLTRGTVTTETRKRGIFSVPVYKLELNLSGRFSRPDFGSLGLEPIAVAWERAHLVVGIADTRAIQQETTVNWQGASASFVPGTGGFADAGTGIHAVVGFTEGTPAIEFSLPLSLNGSQGVFFTPFGKNTVVELDSNYPHPSFQGNWLPNERTVNADGFKARWAIPFLGRSFPQAWTSQNKMDNDIAGSGFGVDFLNPVDHYRMAERSVKYASLFILLTFATLWLFEVRAGVRVHPIQFLMLGGALCLFYLLLLALSEHMGFTLAYGLASVSVIGMVAAYGVVVLRGLGKALAVGLGVAFLYAYLYVLLVNEDYALLIGSIGLFLILGLIMYATRHVDWYDTGARDRP